MRPHSVTRRDFLKLLGAAGLTAPLTGVLTRPGRSPRISTGADRPNIILILFDALSARHMSLYGYHRNTTPNIADFARRSTMFHRHHSASSHTRPSTGSLLTGTYPWSHRALNYYSAPLDFYTNANLFSSITSDYHIYAYTHNQFVNTMLNRFVSSIDELKPIGDLALLNPDELLSPFRRDSPVGFYASKHWRDHYMGASSSLFLNPMIMLMQILAGESVEADYRDQYPLGLSDNQEGYLFRLEDAIDYIGQMASTASTPFLGFFHLLPPHEAYKPRADFLYTFSNDNLRLVEKPPHLYTDNLTQMQLEEYSQRYDEYIAFVDSEFGRLYRNLERNGALENTYLILTSDHGQLFERGIHGHGTRTLYEPLLHIPLLIHAPGQDQQIDIHSTTSNIDLLPTIIALAHQKAPDWSDGRILPTLGGTEDRQRVIFSMDGKENARRRPLTRATFSALAWPYKLITYRGYPGYNDMDELYNIESDPEELSNLASAKPSTVAELKDILIRNQISAEEKSIGRSLSEPAD